MKKIKTLVGCILLSIGLIIFNLPVMAENDTEGIEEIEEIEVIEDLKSEPEEPTDTDIDATVAITLADPVAGAELSTAASSSTTGVSVTVSWTPAHTPAEYDTEYSATLVITAQDGYVFPQDVNVTVNGNAAGSVTRDTDKQVTASYTFASTGPEPSKDVASYTAPTAASGLKYNGQALPLVTGGESDEGTLYYRIGTSGQWTSTVPTALNAGTYTIYYYVKGDSTHSDAGSTSDPAGDVTVTVGKATGKPSGISLTKTIEVASPSTSSLTPAAVGANISGASIVSLTKNTDTSSILTISGTSYTIKSGVASGTTATATATISSNNFENFDIEVTFKVAIKDTGVAPTNFKNTTSATNNAGGAKLNNSNDQLYKALLTAEEKQKVLDGENCSVNLQSKSITSTVSDAEKKLIEDAMGKGYTLGEVYDLKLYKTIGTGDAQLISSVPNGTVSISLTIPSDLRKTGRVYRMVRVHNGSAKALSTTLNTDTYTITFDTNVFSTYGLTYSDEAVTESAMGKTASAKTGDVRSNRRLVMSFFGTLFIIIGFLLIVCRPEDLQIVTKTKALGEHRYSKDEIAKALRYKDNEV